MWSTAGPGMRDVRSSLEMVFCGTPEVVCLFSKDTIASRCRDSPREETPETGTTASPSPTSPSPTSPAARSEPEGRRRNPTWFRCATCGSDANAAAASNSNRPVLPLLLCLLGVRPEEPPTGGFAPSVGFPGVFPMPDKIESRRAPMFFCVAPEPAFVR